MASELQALPIRPEPPSEDDYRTLCAALEASARGRGFLSEYARRNRNADTEILLAAIDRLSGQIHVDAAALQQLRAELRTLLVAIRLARPNIDAGRAPDKTAALTELVDLLERRIDGLVDNKTAAQIPAARAEAMRPQLAVVSPSAEPELPVASSATPPPVTAAIADEAPATRPARAAIMPEVTVFDSTPPAAKPKPAAGKIEPPSAERLRLLAPIIALSEDERLALFS